MPEPGAFRPKRENVMRQAILIFWAMWPLFALPVSGACQTPGRVVLTTLSWPPYASSALPGGGQSVETVRRALAATGLTLDAQFYPWKRAVAMALRDPAVQGYFPEYYDDGVAVNFLFSEPIGEGPLGFIERADKPVSWKRLADLKGLRIGVTLGYVNTAAFDRMAASGELTADPAVDDAANVRKLAAGRLDLAVIDLNVFAYLARPGGGLEKEAEKLRVNPRLLAMRELYVCFRKGPGAEKLAARFNEGLRRVLDGDAGEATLTPRTE